MDLSSQDTEKQGTSLIIIIVCLCVWLNNIFVVRTPRTHVTENRLKTLARGPRPVALPIDVVHCVCVCCGCVCVCLCVCVRVCVCVSLSLSLTITLARL